MKKPLRILAISLVLVVACGGNANDLATEGGPPQSPGDDVLATATIQPSETATPQIDPPTATPVPPATATPVRPTATATATVPPCVASAQAAGSAGRRVTVCGTVSGTSYRPDVRGAPTFINFDRAFPNHTLTAVVWGDSRGRFNPPPEVQFGSGKRVCVTGLVEIYQGKPQIVVNQANQMWVC